MKAFVIAATSLAISGAAFAQTATSDAPAVVVQTPEQTPAQTTVGQAADEAVNSAKEAAKSAADAAKAVGADAAAAAGNAASDAAATAKAAGQAAEAAAEKAVTAAESAAKDAAEDAAKAADAAASSANEAGQQTKAIAADAAHDAATAAEAATDSAKAAVKEAEAVVAAPDVSAPAISETEPGILGSWMTSRRIWTTNEPSSTAWDNPALTERPAEWQDIAKVDDVVLDRQGQLVGYVADIGGFLGIGAKKVLLGKDAIHLVQVGKDRFYATNFTKAELEALPDFNPATVVK